MPIHEYECLRCAGVSAHLVMKRSDRSALSCPRCGGRRLKRVLSAFAVIESEASRLRNFDPARPRDESFYRDPRNIGLTAKSRARRLGADLGEKFETTLERARSGQLIKEMFQ
jgi:putative FmdB family regulatory protein